MMRRNANLEKSKIKKKKLVFIYKRPDLVFNTKRKSFVKIGILHIEGGGGKLLIFLTLLHFNLSHIS